MALETRGNHSYYYRKRRIGDRVVSEYVGRGEVAALISQLDVLEREQRETERWLAAAERANLEVADQEAAAFASLLATLTQAVLVANGFYQHKRQWRRHRERID